MGLKPRLRSINLRDFRCVDATDILAAIHEEHRLGEKYKLGRETLKQLKGLLSSIFRHAKQGGVLDGENPAKDARIPRKAAASRPTHAYSVEEVMAMLDALDGTARTAVALMYFCGLRPGEALAAKWEDYDGKRLKIRASMWRKHRTDPKTPESVATQIVPETLADILAESRRESGYVLTSPLGRFVDLHNMSTRVVRPALAVQTAARKKQSMPQPTMNFSRFRNGAGFTHFAVVSRHW